MQTEVLVEKDPFLIHTECISRKVSLLNLYRKY